MRPLFESEAFLRIASPAAAGLGIVAAWEVVCRYYQIPAFLFPAPTAIAASLVDDAPALLRALMMTMKVALIAFAAAVVIGTLIAFVFVQSKVVERAFLPYAVVLQVTPIVAIAPLMIASMRVRSSPSSARRGARTHSAPSPVIWFESLIYWTSFTAVSRWRSGMNQR